MALFCILYLLRFPCKLIGGITLGANWYSLCTGHDHILWSLFSLNLPTMASLNDRSINILHLSGTADYCRQCFVLVSYNWSGLGLVPEGSNKLFFTQMLFIASYKRVKRLWTSRQVYLHRVHFVSPHVHALNNSCNTSCCYVSVQEGWSQRDWNFIILFSTDSVSYQKFLRKLCNAVSGYISLPNLCKIWNYKW
jgi:hypothetical protein